MIDSCSLIDYAEVPDDDGDAHVALLGAFP